MPARTHEERVLIARIAAADRWGHTPDRAAATQPARAGLRAKFAREVLATSPHASAEELARRTDDLMRAHMLRMSLKAAQSRRRDRSQRVAPDIKTVSQP